MLFPDAKIYIIKKSMYEVKPIFLLSYFSLEYSLLSGFYVGKVACLSLG